MAKFSQKPLEFAVDFGSFGTLLAATGNDAYNTLVMNEYAFDFGRKKRFPVGACSAQTRHVCDADITLGGRRCWRARQPSTSLRKAAMSWASAQPSSRRNSVLTDLVASKDARWSAGPRDLTGQDRRDATSDQAFAPAADDIVIGH